MKKTKKLLGYQMLETDVTGKEYVCPLSFIEEVKCPAKVSRDHKHIIVLLLDHTHSPTLASEYKGQLKSKGIRVKGGNHSKEHSKTNGVIHTVGEDPKKLEAPSYALERAQNSKLSIYKGERTVIEGYMLMSIDLGPNPRTNGHKPLNGESSRLSNSSARLRVLLDHKREIIQIRFTSIPNAFLLFAIILIPTLTTSAFPSRSPSSS